MSKIVFLDSSVFIWAYNRPESNSAKILELANESKIKVIISEKVVEELKRYFTTYHSNEVWFAVYSHLASIATMISRERIGNEMKLLKGKIKLKDMEHLATVRTLSLNYLIAFDRDFGPFKEYRTPKQFLKELGMKTFETKY